MGVNGLSGNLQEPSLAGITIKDPGLYQISDKEETETTQQEKQ